MSKVILVTGANRGIGLGIVRRLIARAPPRTRPEEVSPTNGANGEGRGNHRPWTIIVACRTRQAAVDTIQKLNDEESQAGNATLEPLEIELDSDESIGNARREVEEKFGRLDGKDHLGSVIPSGKGQGDTHGYLSPSPNQ